MVLSTSIDGFTAGSPLAALTDGRDAMLAIAMNGQLLPQEHGFPARLVVPGLYGYVSATKWVVDLEVTRFDQAAGLLDAARVVGRWDRSRPSRASTCPHDGSHVKAGTVAVAGVAWAVHRGIQKVEVQVDDGPWATARLAADVERRHLAAVGLRVAGDARRAPAAGAGHRRHRRRADVGRRAAAAQRRLRLRPDPGHRQLSPSVGGSRRRAGRRAWQPRGEPVRGGGHHPDPGLGPLGRPSPRFGRRDGGSGRRTGRRGRRRPVESMVRVVGRERGRDGRGPRTLARLPGGTGQRGGCRPCAVWSARAAPTTPRPCRAARARRGDEGRAASPQRWRPTRCSRPSCRGSPAS